MIDPDSLADTWTTVAVNPVPFAMIAAYEDGPGFYTAPCSAILLQERRVDFGQVETRAIAAVFDWLGGGGGELHPVDSIPLGCTDDDLYAVMTAEEWKVEKPRAERHLNESITHIKEQILGGLRSLPDGLTAPELERAVRRTTRRRNRVVLVFNDLCETDDRVVWTWESRPGHPDANAEGMVEVVRLAPHDAAAAAD